MKNYKSIWLDRAKRYLSQIRLYLTSMFRLCINWLESSHPGVLDTLNKLSTNLHKFVESYFALADHSAIRKPRILFRITVFFFLVILLWSILFKIDQVVHAQGVVIASDKTQIVQAADGGVLERLYVREGDLVQKGQLIAVLEKERALAAYHESRGKVAGLRLTVMRLRAELSESDLLYDQEMQKQYPLLVETQLNLFQKRREAFRETLKILSENIKLAEAELRLNEPLEKFGDISKADILRLRRAVNEARGTYINQRSKYFQDASTELNKAEEDLNAQQQNLNDKTMILEHTDVLAPATGIVKSVKINTEGGVVRQGEEILEILPTESRLLIEAKVRPVDMTKMHVGLPATVKLDAFDYSVFGSMNGVVSYVSPDSLTEETKSGSSLYYRAHILLDQPSPAIKSIIDVRPGMTATVDIKSDERSILAYLMKPIVKTISESMGER